MADTETHVAVVTPRAPEKSALTVVVESAVEALVSAVVLWFLGGIAFTIAGAFAGQMVPSVPPGFGGSAELEATPHSHHHAWWHAARGPALGVFFLIFFTHSLWQGFYRGETGLNRHLQQILRNLREHWFGLIVGNAIGAWVAALVLGIMQNFSLWHLIWQWVLGLVLPILRHGANWLLGPSKSHGLSDWFSWYNANQNKLMFWVLYLAGICDDLGVPNFKTLARWAWRKWHKPTAAPRQSAA